MEVVFYVGIVCLVITALYFIAKWAEVKRAQTEAEMAEIEKEITLAAIKAGLVQQPVQKVILDTWERQRFVTELAWVKK